jgi:hypothetical protein
VIKILVLQEDGNQIMEEDIEIPGQDESLVEVPNMDDEAHVEIGASDSENYD